MNDKDTVITHLMIIHTWASVARERDIYFFTDRHLEHITQWVDDTLKLLKEQEQAMKEKDGTISNLIAQIKEISQCYERVVRCKDCDNRECDGRAGTIVCGITGESHSRLWFCAEGRKKDE